MPLGKLNIESIDTSKLLEFQKNLDKMPQRINASIKVVVHAAGNEVKSQLKAGTPVASGEMRENWSIRRGVQDSNTVSSISIRNTTIQSVAVDMGSESEELPWPNPTKGRGRVLGRKRVPERTVKSKGRVWSTQAVGGVTGKVINKSVLNRLCNNIVAAVGNILVK